MVTENIILYESISSSISAFLGALFAFFLHLVLIRINKKNTHFESIVVYESLLYKQLNILDDNSSQIEGIIDCLKDYVATFNSLEAIPDDEDIRHKVLNIKLKNKLHLLATDIRKLNSDYSNINSFIKTYTQLRLTNPELQIENSMINTLNKLLEFSKRVDDNIIKIQAHLRATNNNHKIIRLFIPISDISKRSAYEEKVQLHYNEILEEIKNNE